MSEQSNHVSPNHSPATQPDGGKARRLGVMAGLAGWLKLAGVWNMPAWAVSLVVHCLGVTALVMATLAPLPPSQKLNLTATEEPVAEELVEMQLDFEPELEELEFQAAAPQLKAEAFETPQLEVDPNMLGEAIAADQFMPAQQADFAGLDPNGLMSELSGMGDGIGNAAKFFGTGASGKRICFLVDNSISMSGGRMETALIELEKAVRKLSPTQEFFIIFYSDTAYPLFYPESATKMVDATGENKQRVSEWLETIHVCNFTNGREAITMALKMEPDLIYILGDGAFTDAADYALIETPTPGITIHTLGMHVKASDARRFSTIAEKHGGSYRDVGITPQGSERLRKNGPIPYHKKREGIWGIKLPG
ncbi:VWA domain-containing protein [Blastopirellula marina]|uniref:Uncharacterized protein n=1 Tax=Blastopirellula marina TaxID=124 RepID=A0A2S8GDR6_9BACT|nr:VWA domain-containing protein [Blastopirellula marina]PQO42596.1 hypothetical protein C5Y98_01800 [Blastopirellula marina]PTL46362.1 hypothetical protein C5Y97_01800 [Blastopirellula marina]